MIKISETISWEISYENSSEKKPDLKLAQLKDLLQKVYKIVIFVLIFVTKNT